MESVDEVVRVNFGDVFDSKVVDTQGECCFEVAVLPHASRVWHWFVSLWCQQFDELVESEYAGFLETIHTFVNLKVYESVG